MIYYRGVMCRMRQARIFCAVLFCLLSLMRAGLSWAQAPAASPDPQMAIDQRSQEIQELERQIDVYTKEIASRQTRARTLKNDIATLDAQIQRTQLEIKRLAILIAELSEKIKKREKGIAKAEAEIRAKRLVLGEHFRALREYDAVPYLAVFLGTARFSEFFVTFQGLEVVERRIYEALLGVKYVKAGLESEKAALEEDRKTQNELRRLAVVEKEDLTARERQKRELLAATRGEESRFQQLVKLSKAGIERLRNEIYYLQRIGVTAEDAAKFGVLVANRVGVRPAFLIAILEVESRLGANVGSGIWKTDMHPRDHEAFLRITRELGLNPDTTPVSKKPGYGWGGAMGPAQFLPTTWLAWRDRVAQLSGHNPPSPWNIEDAFFAAALKLAAGGAAAKSAEGELAASRAYISGSPYCSRSICNYYANLALEKAAAIERTLHS